MACSGPPPHADRARAGIRVGARATSIPDAGTGGAGWYIIGGTSEATPIFSGIVALADQVAGHRLGLLNPALYALGAASGHVPATGVVDITAGNNSFAGVTGYDAASGYDLASGWGTINAARFVPALALTAGH